MKMPKFRPIWSPKAVGLVSLVLVSCGTVYYFAPSLKGWRPANGGLRIEDSRLQLGEVWETENYTCELPIQNSTDGVVDIVDFVSSCSCLSVAPKGLTLEAREYKTINAKMDLSNSPCSAAYSLCWDFEARIIPLLRFGPAMDIGWMLQAKVRRAFLLSPTFVDFEETLVHGKPFSGKTISVTTDPLITNVTVQCNPKLASVEVIRRTDDPAHFSIKITPAKTLPIGPFSGQVSIDGTKADGGLLPGKKLPISGLIMDDIRAAPAQVSFGAAPLGDLREETITLQSSTRRSFDILGVDDVPKDLEVKPSPHNLTHCRSFRLFQHITKPDNQMQRIRFLIRRDSGDTIAIPVIVNYFGVKQLE